MLEPLHRAIYLTGATASGKSAVGVELAHRLDAEIVAVDSMTLYRGMDIGTAKPTAAERRGIPHHLIDVLDPWQAASVAEYRTWALAAVDEIERRGKRALFVGGTPLYLKALLRGLFQGPGADPALRVRLENEADERGSEVLHERLAAVDPATAARLHPNDRRRIIRRSRSWNRPVNHSAAFRLSMSGQPPRKPWSSRCRGPRPQLHDRINRRVTAMFDAGLVEEVRDLWLAPRPLSSGRLRRAWDTARSSRWFRAGSGWGPRSNESRPRSRQFAKRQCTWFRGLSEVRPWPVGPRSPPSESPSGWPTRSRPTRREGETANLLFPGSSSSAINLAVEQPYSACATDAAGRVARVLPVLTQISQASCTFGAWR